jgi:hypothetical protein
VESTPRKEKYAPARAFQTSGNAADIGQDRASDRLGQGEFLSGPTNPRFTLSEIKNIQPFIINILKSTYQ